MASTEWTEVEKAIQKIANVFTTHGGKKGMLTTGEFKELVALQLPNLMKDVGDLEEKMKSFRIDCDNGLSIEDFCQLIRELAKELKKEKVGKKK
ncbi:protein S100-A13-like [Elgaria multicarinata webbii]|uniref:protein S100-A13-like n=1 Tax=Elgaria multicarinata webbii TaxID=159646 RepID=UPI002FCD5767